jgi:hypothetical protein
VIIGVLCPSASWTVFTAAPLWKERCEIVEQTMQAEAGRQPSTSDRHTRPHCRPVRAVQWPAMSGEEREPRQTLMDVPGGCPIFDDDLANRVHFDVSSKGQLNDFRQLDGAPAGLCLELTQVRRNPGIRLSCCRT